MSNKWKKRRVKFKGFLWHTYSLLLLRYAPFNRWLVRRSIKRCAFDRLHLGCGTILVKGWLNIGFERREEYGRITEKQGAAYLNYDLRKPWPVDDNSIAYITASHFIEHFDLNGGIRFAKNAYRALGPGGIIRLNCPDLETYARHYVAGNKSFFEHKAIQRGCYFNAAVTPGEIFAAKAYDSGGAHKWFYDAESLMHILAEAGFQEVRKARRADGTVPDLEIIEPLERELESVYVEAVKKR